MENIASFFGGIIALAVLGILLFFELAMESMFFVYVIYALIIIVAGALVISIRGSIAALIRTLTGRVSRIKPPPREVPQGIEEGRKIERFFKTSKPPAQELKGPGQVKNPLLKNMMEKLKEKKEKPRRKSRFSGLAKRLRGIRMPRPKLPKIRIKKPGKSKKKPPKEKPRPVIEERPKGAEKSMLEKIKKGLPKISRSKSLVKPKAAGKPKPEKPVKEIVSRSVQSRTRDRASLARDVSANDALRDADISSSKAKEEMKKPKLKEKRPEKPKEEPREIPAAKPKPIVKPKPGPVPKARPAEPLISRLEEDVEESKGRAPVKKAGMEEAAKPGGSCQICGSSKGLKIHYIVPPEKGGTREEENTILLCGTHKEQAEEGMYSENLLRKLRGS